MCLYVAHATKAVRLPHRPAPVAAGPHNPKASKMSQLKIRPVVQIGNVHAAAIAELRAYANRQVAKGGLYWMLVNGPQGKGGLTDADLVAHMGTGAATTTRRHRRVLRLHLKAQWAKAMQQG